MSQYTEEKKRNEINLPPFCPFSVFGHKKTLEKPVLSRVFEEIKNAEKGT